MKKTVIYFCCFVAVVLIVWVYRTSNQKVMHDTKYAEIDNRIKTVSVSNDSLLIQFKNNYFDSIFISSEVTSVKKERFTFNNVLAVKNGVSKIPLKEMIGYEGEKYRFQQLKMMRFEIRALDSVFMKTATRDSNEFYKTEYNHYELWYLDTLNKFKMGRALGGIFFIRK